MNATSIINFNNPSTDDWDWHDLHKEKQGGREERPRSGGVSFSCRTRVARINVEVKVELKFAPRVSGEAYEPLNSLAGLETRRVVRHGKWDAGLIRKALFPPLPSQLH